jgi:hypothetical protein
MEPYILKSSFLQRSPRVWHDESNLYARTSRWYQFLNLFSYCRTVEVSKEKQQVIIRVRKFWFIANSTAIPFNKIEFVERYHWDVCTGEVGLTPNGFGSTSVTEVWYVRIIVKGIPLPVNLFRFLGTGSRIVGGWWQMIIGGLPFDIEGRQDFKSESYAKLVAGYTGVAYRG